MSNDSSVSLIVIPALLAAFVGVLVGGLGGLAIGAVVGSVIGAIIRWVTTVERRLQTLEARLEGRDPD